MSIASPQITTLPTVVTGTEVEQAVRKTLEPRLQYYVEQLGWETVRSWVFPVVTSRFPEDQIPSVMIVCTGLAQDPQRLNGWYRAVWSVEVGAMVSAKTEEQTRKMARDYGALIRAIMVQEPGLHGFADATDWIDEAFNDATATDRRSITMVQLSFHVTVDQVVSFRELPSMPPDGPLPTPGPTISEVDVDVYRVPITRRLP